MTEQSQNRYWPIDLAAVLRSEGRRQDWLAEKAMVHPSFISHLAAGRKSAPQDVAERIASALGRDFFVLWKSADGVNLAPEMSAA
jgi:plasmid maintenance system antidote protein VapI